MMGWLTPSSGTDPALQLKGGGARPGGEGWGRAPRGRTLVLTDSEVIGMKSSINGLTPLPPCHCNSLMFVNSVPEV